MVIADRIQLLLRDVEAAQCPRPLLPLVLVFCFTSFWVMTGLGLAPLSMASPTTVLSSFMDISNLVLNMSGSFAIGAANGLGSGIGLLSLDQPLSLTLCDLHHGFG